MFITHINVHYFQVYVLKEIEVSWDLIFTIVLYYISIDLTDIETT